VKTYYDGRVTVHGGDCLAVLAELPADSFDAVCTDPPYHFASIVKRFGADNAAEAKSNGATGVYRRASRGFMGKQWDGGQIAHDPATWAAVLRVLKPGGHMVAFHAPKNWHRLAGAIEDAGFEIRDTLLFLFGAGFPKSHNVAAGIEKRRQEDVEPIRRVCRFIRAAMDRQGVRSPALVHHFGNCHHRLIDHWAARDTDSQPSLPTTEQWSTLKSVLGLGDEMDAEVARLNARKGEFGEAYKAREIVGEVEEWTDRTNYALTSRDGLKRGGAISEAAREWEGWGTALKPAVENIVLARKPSDYSPEWVTMNRLLNELGGCLWSMLSAKDAASHFGLSPDEHERLASAQWNAEHASNIRAALCDQMATPLFEWALISSLSTVFSWRSTLDAIWNSGNTSITATELRTTTDWRTLKSFLSQITPDIIIRDQLPEARSNAPAFLVARLFSGTLARLSATLEQPALENAIAPFARHFRDADDLSPAYEPIVLARKPLVGTIAANVMKHGTGALNIDACRVGHASADDLAISQSKNPGRSDLVTSATYGAGRPQQSVNALGRWPANVCHDGSDEVVSGFPDAGGGYGVRGESPNWGPASKGGGTLERVGFGDSGSAARFFYTAKADADDRLGSKHPTVKPLDLIQWLVRLITPPGGHILDPFAGTGTTAEAALREGFRCTLIERESEYLADIDRRMAHVFDGEVGRGVAIAKTKPDSTAPAPLLDYIEEAKASTKHPGRRAYGKFARHWGKPI
jgi:DNA modification methylase